MGPRSHGLVTRSASSSLEQKAPPAGDVQLTINRPGAATETVGSAQSGGGGADPMAFDPSPHVQRLIEDMLSDAAKRV